MNQLVERRDVALQKAVMLFWERGAEVASYPDIVKATGLSRKALYEYWPDKDALISDTLEFYRANMLSQMLAPLQSAVFGGFGAFWAQFELVGDAKSWRGCYLFRTASGPLRNRTYVLEHLEPHLDALTTGFKTCIEDGVARGYVDRVINVEAVVQLNVCAASTVSTLGAAAGYTSRVASMVAAARASVEMKCGSNN